MPIGERWGKLLNSKPSISKFGFANTTNAAKRQTLDLHRQTVLGAAMAAQAALDEDAKAEDALKRNMNRRSADLWREAGHARPTSSRFERAREMMKPAPALCMMDENGSPVNKRQSMQQEGVRRMSSSMAVLSKRMSQAFGAGAAASADSEDIIEMSQYVNVEASQPRAVVEAGPSSPAIQVTSPSRYDRRLSAMSSSNTHATDAEDSPERSADGHDGGEVVAIHTATRGRMSAGPMYILGGIRSPT